MTQDVVVCTPRDSDGVEERERSAPGGEAGFGPWAARAAAGLGGSCVSWKTARTLAGPDGRAWSIGLGDDVAMFYSEGRGPELIHAPQLGRDLRVSELEVGPDVAIMLYPDLVPPEVKTRLRDAGFEEVQRLPGWLDWDRGDVTVWQREP